MQKLGNRPRSPPNLYTGYTGQFNDYKENCASVKPARPIISIVTYFIVAQARKGKQFEIRLAFGIFRPGTSQGARERDWKKSYLFKPRLTGFRVKPPVYSIYNVKALLGAGISLTHCL